MRNFVVVFFLIFFSSQSFAATQLRYGLGFFDADRAYYSSPQEACDARAAQKGSGWTAVFSAGSNSGAEYVGYCYVCRPGKPCPSYWESKVDVFVVQVEVECDDVFVHEGTGETACGHCLGGYIRASGVYDPKSGSEFSTGYHCMRPREPRECEFLGKVEVITDQGAYCVDKCAGPVIDGICLDEWEPEDECNSDHPEYIGMVGYGSNAMPICGDPGAKCPDGYTYGLVSGGNTTVESCFPNEYNPPQCSGSHVLVVDDWGGHSCLPVQYLDDFGYDQSDIVGGDSDGDGQGDLTGIAAQLENIQSLLTKGNTNTNNINETLKGIGNQIGDGIGKLTEAIGNIPGGGGGGSGGKTQIVGEDGSAISWSGSPIDLGLEDIQEEYDGVMQEYQQKIQQIKSEVQGMFGASLSAGGSVDDDVHTIKGVDVNFSINRFLGGLNILGGIVLFVAAFISAGILFTGRG